MRAAILLSAFVALFIVGCSSVDSEIEPTSTSKVSNSLNANWADDWDASFRRTGVNFVVSRDATFESVRSQTATMITRETELLDQQLVDSGIDPKMTIPFCVWSYGLENRVLLLEQKNPGITESSSLVKSAMSDLSFYNDDVELVVSSGNFGRLDSEECGGVSEDVLSLYPQLTGQ